MDKTRVMVVEDEWIVSEEIEKALELYGYEVTSVVNTAEDAVNDAKEMKPDLVLMDIMLYGPSSGIDAAAAITARFNIPVIFLTAHSDSKVLEQAKECSPYGYIVKPFKVEDLHATIQMALDKYAKEQEKDWYTEVS